MTAKSGLSAAITSAHGSFLARTQDTEASAVKHLKDERAIRRAISELEELDDHALKDIGLQRGEIEGRVRTAVGRRR